MNDDKRKNNKKNKYRTTVYISLAILIVAIIPVVIFLLNEYHPLKALDEITVSMFGSMVVAMVATIFAYIIYKPMMYSDDEKSSAYYDNLRDKIILHVDSGVTLTKENNKEQTDDNRDIIELMIANMKEINEYYVLSKRMTRQSFILAVCMCIGGFMIISISVAFILINNLEAKEAIIPVISGAVIEAIAATTLIVYKKSLEQLNRYYDALHNNEIFLSSVNLVSKISTERRDQMYEYIIKTKLEDKPKQNNTKGQ